MYPQKTLVGSSKAIQTARRGEEFGFRVSVLEVDWPRIQARKDAIVSSMVKSIEGSLERNPRIDLLRGSARFLGRGRLAVGDGEVEAAKVIVASGVAPVIPDVRGLAEAGYETNETVMDMEGLPGSMVVIGGGPEGMEFAQIFHRLGVKVTVLQRRDRVLPSKSQTQTDNPKCQHHEDPNDRGLGQCKGVSRSGTERKGNR